MRAHIFLLIGFFAASTQAATLSLSTREKDVPRYGKIEFVLRTDARFVNPYDPAEIDLQVEIAAPTGKKFLIPAFFLQPFDFKLIERGNRKLAWLYPAAGPFFAARFAPTEPGQYSAVALLRQNKTESRSAPVSFICTASKDRGFVRVSRTDPRYFEFDDATPYFAVGQNVAFIKEPGANADMIRKLGAAGGNFARVWCCCEDWGMAIESHKSAWTRSWDKRNPFSKMEGDPSGRLYVKLSGDAGVSITCNPADPVALKPGTRYRLAGRAMLIDGAALSINIGKTITVTGKPGEWQSFNEEFTTSPNQLFFQQVVFRLTAKGTAWIDRVSLEEGSDEGKETGKQGDKETGNLQPAISGLGTQHPGLNLLTDADPNTPSLGVYHPLDCAVLDKIVETAEKSGVYLQLTMLTRNLYMNQLSKADSDEYRRATRLARNVLRYFVARWGYSTHVISWEYFNEMDPGKPMEKFYSELAEYFDSIDVNKHLRATSDWHFPTKAFQHPRLDQADLHFYLRPPSGESWKDAVGSIQAQWAKCSARLGSPRPLLLSEFGITDDKWQMHNAVRQDKDWLHWHDGNWAAMLSGFASTGCHWYWDEIHKRDAYASVYSPLAKFAADIPWTTARFAPAVASADQNLRVLGLVGAGRAYLYVSDPAATWHAAAIDGKSPARIRSSTIRLENLPPGKYQVHWWDTRKGEAVEKQTVDSTGILIIKPPPFERAIACKITG